MKENTKMKCKDSQEEMTKRWHTSWQNSAKIWKKPSENEGEITTENAVGVEGRNEKSEQKF